VWFLMMIVVWAVTVRCLPSDPFLPVELTSSGTRLWPILRLLQAAGQSTPWSRMTTMSPGSISRSLTSRPTFEGLRSGHSDIAGSAGGSLD